MKKFFFLLVLGFSCNQPQPISAQGCSFDLNIVNNECGEALLRVENCLDCSSYNWNTGATSRSLVVTQSGTYRVTVTSFTNQCTSVAQVSVQVAPPCNQGCSFDIATNNSGCGQATLEVVNCPDCFAYQWSNGATTKAITVNSSGTYTVTVTGGGGACTSKASKTVEVSSAPTVMIKGDGLLCEGSSLALEAVSPNLVEPCWSTGAKTYGIIVSQPGTYTVTVTSPITGCTATSSKEVVMVHAPQTPTISAEVIGDKIVLTAFPPASGYLWSNGATSPTVTVTSSMTLSVRTKNHEGCLSESSCPVPVMVLTVKDNTANDGSSPSNCNKNGIWASNGMPYGAVFKATTSQLFLYAPPGANRYSCTWNQGQGGSNGWVLAKTSPGTHSYLLECKMDGDNSGKKYFYCFQYTVVNNFDDDDVETESRSSEEEVFIPEEYREEILQMNVYPNPTIGPIRIEAEMEIPANQPSGIYILRIFDINGRPVGEPKKVMKQE